MVRLPGTPTLRSISDLATMNGFPSNHSRGDFVMSFKSFVSMPDVAAKIKSLRPAISRKIPVQIKVEPRSKRYSLIGTAFDYLLRFELQRRAPHAVSNGWVRRRRRTRVMQNWAILNRGILSDRHYTMKGTAPNYFFNLRPSVLSKFIRRFSDSFSLVIIGDKSVDDDFYAIPFARVKHLFTEDTLTKGANPGRWLDIRDCCGNRNCLGS